jgi:hypothetical protein
MKPALPLAAALLALSLGTAVADAIVTRSNLRVEGKILSEDERQVILSSEYGELRFLKVDLARIERGAGGAAPAPAPAGDPNADPSLQPGFNPFDAMAGDAAAAPGGEPFGAPPPFGEDPNGGSIFGAAPAAPAGTPTATAPPRIRTPERATPPAVPDSYQLVLHGIPAEAPIFTRTSGDWEPAAEDAAVRTPAELQSRNVTTAAATLKTGDLVRLAHDTHLLLTRIAEQEGIVQGTLQRGAVWVQVAPRAEGQSFSLRTSELQVEGGTGRFTLDRTTGASRVSVAEGTVSVTSLSTKVRGRANAGESLIVTSTGQILSPTPADPSITSAWDAWDDTPLEQLLPTGALAVTVDEVNRAWDKQMAEREGGFTELAYQAELNRYAESFLRFATDTGVIPESTEGWSFLKFDPGLPGWAGPYIEGPVPPLDPWKQPLVYVKKTSNSGNPFGRVYSMWQDGRDQGGENTSVDKVALVMYFTIPQFAKKDGP